MRHFTTGSYMEFISLERTIDCCLKQLILLKALQFLSEAKKNKTKKQTTLYIFHTSENQKESFFVSQIKI